MRTRLALKMGLGSPTHQQTAHRVRTITEQTVVIGALDIGGGGIRSSAPPSLSPKKTYPGHSTTSAPATTQPRLPDRVPQLSVINNVVLYPSQRFPPNTPPLPHSLPQKHRHGPRHDAPPTSQTFTDLPNKHLYRHARSLETAGPPRPRLAPIPHLGTTHGRRCAATCQEARGRLPIRVSTSIEPFGFSQVFSCPTPRGSCRCLVPIAVGRPLSWLAETD